MKNLEEYIINHRHTLHRSPEISFEEVQTTNYIKEVLEGFGCFELEFLAKTGIVATLKATNKIKPTIAFRADIDALELEEKSELEFASQNNGVMHACGHDAHTAILLGLAKILAKEKDLLRGDVKLIFQRAEEIAPGGARELVDKGVMEGVKRIFALHLFPGRKSGTISIKRSVATANKNTFDIYVKGKGGHSSAPQNCIDPILIASAIVMNLQSIVARNISPFDPGVVSLASFSSGSEYGVVPDSARLTGAIRSFDKDTREMMKSKLAMLVENTALAYGGEAEVKFSSWDYSAVYNDEDTCRSLENIVLSKFGSECLIKDNQPQSFSEDFSEYLEQAKGCMVWLGVGEKAPKLHSPYFNPDESAFIAGAKFFHEIVKEYSYAE